MSTTTKEMKGDWQINFIACLNVVIWVAATALWIWHQKNVSLFSCFSGLPPPWRATWIWPNIPWTSRPARYNLRAVKTYFVLHCKGSWTVQLEFVAGSWWVGVMSNEGNQSAGSKHFQITFSHLLSWRMHTLVRVCVCSSWVFIPHSKTWYLLCICVTND